MKKLLFAFLLPLMLSAGGSKPEKVINPQTGAKPFSGDIEETIYDGHKYVIFREKDANGYACGIGLSALHSPDCPCSNKKESNH